MRSVRRSPGQGVAPGRIRRSPRSRRHLQGRPPRVAPRRRWSTSRRHPGCRRAAPPRRRPAGHWRRPARTRPRPPSRPGRSISKPEAATSTRPASTTSPSGTSGPRVGCATHSTSWQPLATSATSVISVTDSRAADQGRRATPGPVSAPRIVAILDLLFRGRPVDMREWTDPYVRPITSRSDTTLAVIDEPGKCRRS